MKRIIAPFLVACVAAITPLHAQTFVSLPPVDGQVNAFAAFGDTLYIGGDFTMVDNTPRNGLAAIDLKTHTLVATFDANLTYNNNPAGVKSLAMSADGTRLYVGGFFDKVGGTARNNLAAVDPTGALVTGFNPDVDNQISWVGEHAGSVYFIGDFATVDGTTRKGFGGVDNVGALLTGFDPNAGNFNTSTAFRGAALSGDGTSLYVALGNSAGVDFTNTAGGAVNGQQTMVTLQLSDGRATSFQPGLTRPDFDPTKPPDPAGGFAVAAKDSEFYAGGDFDMASGHGVDRLASFHSEVYDSAFSPETGTGPDGAVRAIKPDGSFVYVTGSFDNIGPTARKGIAVLDAATGSVVSTWDAQSSIKLGTANEVLFIHGGEVFIGGQSLINASMLLNQPIRYYGAVTAAPEPTPGPTPVPPQPTPVPTPAPKAPTVNISPIKKTTTKARVTIDGTAGGSVTEVTYKIGRKGGTAIGKNKWHFSAKLDQGPNAITVIAHGPDGASKPDKVTIKLK